MLINLWLIHSFIKWTLTEYQLLFCWVWVIHTARTGASPCLPPAVTWWGHHKQTGWLAGQKSTRWEDKPHTDEDGYLRVGWLGKDLFLQGWFRQMPGEKNEPGVWRAWRRHNDGWPLGLSAENVNVFLTYPQEHLDQHAYVTSGLIWVMYDKQQKKKSLSLLLRKRKHRE